MSTNGVRPRSCPPPAITAEKGRPDLGDLLDRQLCGFLAFKDATDIDSVNPGRPITHICRGDE